jgi:hypothetical protein
MTVEPDAAKEISFQNFFETPVKGYYKIKE